MVTGEVTRHHGLGLSLHAVFCVSLACLTSLRVCRASPVHCDRTASAPPLDIGRAWPSVLPGSWNSAQFQQLHLSSDWPSGLGPLGSTRVDYAILVYIWSSSHFPRPGACDLWLSDWFFSTLCCSSGRLDVELNGTITWVPAGSCARGPFGYHAPPSRRCLPWVQFVLISEFGLVLQVCCPQAVRLPSIRSQHRFAASSTRCHGPKDTTLVRCLPCSVSVLGR